MSSVELHLVEYRFKRQNPDASTSEVSRHLLRKLAESLASSEVLENLLEILFKSLEKQSLIDPGGSDIDCACVSDEYGELGSRFQALARGMLKASSTENDVEFLCHVLNFCNQSQDDGARLWHHLRSVRDSDGYTPLHRAVILGFRRVVKLLVTPVCERTAEISSGRPAGDPLEFSDFRVRAWADGHPLEFADFDVLHARTTGEGWTPLHFAAIAKRLRSDQATIEETSLYKPLITDGVNHVVAEDTKFNEVGVATGPGENDTLDVLMMLYDNVKKPDDEIWDFADNFWMTPLHYAVLCNNWVQVKRLLAWKTYERHVNAGDYHQKTPLHMAVCHPNPLRPLSERARVSKVFRKVLESHIPQAGREMIDTLAECPKVDFHAADCCLYTALHWAAHVGNTEAVKCLVSLTGGKRVRATRKDIGGRSPLRIAIENGAVCEPAGRSERLNWKYLTWKDEDEVAKLDFNGLSEEEEYEDIRQVLLSCGDVKDEIARSETKRQSSVDGMNALLVASALVAGSTFQGWLQSGSSGSSTESGGNFQNYLWNNSQAFFFSVASLFAAMLGIFFAHSYICIRRFSILRIIYLVFDLRCISYFLLTSSVYSLLFAYVYYGKASSNDEEKHNKGYYFALLVPVPFIGLASPIFKGIPNFILALPNSSRKHSECLKTIRRKLESTWARSCVPLRQTSEIQEDRARIKVVLNDRAFNSVQLGSLADRQSRNGLIQSEIGNNLWHGKAFGWMQAGLSEDCQLGVLRSVYERARNEMYCRNKECSDNMRFLSGSGLMPRKIHFWMKGCSVARCRAHSLEMDRKRWRHITGTFEAQLAKYRSGR